MAIVVFFVLRIAGSFFVGPTTCRDGWHSPSIGRRGACSHHGGVGLNVGAVLATMVSGGVGLGVYVFLLPSPPASQTPTSRPSAPRPPTSKPPQPTPNRDKAPSSTAIQRGPPPFCPICGASMRRRTSRRGRRSRRGKEFFGCSRYPNCHGVRPIENQPSPGPLFTWADTASRKATDADLSRCRETTPERPPAKISPNTSQEKLEAIADRAKSLLAESPDPQQEMEWAERRLTEAGLLNYLGELDRANPVRWVQQAIEDNPDLASESLPWLRERGVDLSKAETFEELILRLIPSEGGL